MSKIFRLFEEKPYLAWYVRDKKKMSEESMLEHILSYGNWEDFLTVENTWGIEKTNTLYKNLKSKKRVNLRPQTINYFDLYFAKYA